MDFLSSKLHDAKFNRLITLTMSNAFSNSFLKTSFPPPNNFMPQVTNGLCPAD